MKRADAASAQCRVTAQYRSRGGFVYELEDAGTTLALHVLPTETTDDRDAEGWQVAAHNGRDADALVVSESAPTRTEALQRVARTWVEKSFELRLPTLDWDAVTKALRAVRAI